MSPELPRAGNELPVRLTNDVQPYTLIADDLTSCETLQIFNPKGIAQMGRTWNPFTCKRSSFPAVRADGGHGTGNRGCLGPAG